MNTLSILQYPAYNGPANTCVVIAKLLEKQGIYSTSLIPSGTHTLVANHKRHKCDYREADLSRLRISKNPRIQSEVLKNFYGTVNQIRVAIRELDIDTVLVCGMENPHGAIAARLEGKKVVGQVLGLGIPSYARRLVAMWTRYTCDVGMMPGKSLHQYFPGFIQKSKCVFFFPPVDSDTYNFTEKSLDFAESHGIDIGSPVIGTVGNINPAKGLETFILAAGLIKKRLPKAQFLVKGNVLSNQEAYFNRLINMAKRLGIRSDKDIFFIRDSESSVRAISIMDVYVQPSKGEGISTALLEAMSMKRPVVATSVGATEDAVSDQENGILVMPGDGESTSIEILNILKNEQFACSLGEQAREFVLKYASIESCAKAHREAFEIALQKRIN